jgi:quinol-cytochrome oxidoreductase complex cytochrome b subunit
MGTVPLVGEYILKITRGGTKLGALTLVRFYSLHVIFLPIATVILLIGHFLMIRRQGISDPLFKEGKKKTL